MAQLTIGTANPGLNRHQSVVRLKYKAGKYSVFSWWGSSVFMSILQASSHLPHIPAPPQGDVGEIATRTPEGTPELRFGEARELRAASCSLSPPAPGIRVSPGTHPALHRHQHWPSQQQSRDQVPAANGPYPTALPLPQLLSTPGVDSCNWGRGTQVSGAHPNLWPPTLQPVPQAGLCSGLRPPPGFMG